MTKLKWNLPGPDEQGFLRRKREIIELLDASPTPENDNKILEFLLPYVEGGDMETLMDCSRREYGRAILHFLGKSFKVPDPKGERSGE